MSFSRYPEYRDSGVEWLGEVPAHWNVTPLKHVAEFASGGTPDKSRLDYWGGDVPWASAKDMKFDLLLDTADHITAAALTDRAASLVPAGTVLVVVRGMILARVFPVVTTAVPMAINQDLKAVCARAPGRNDWLAWLLRASEPETLKRLDEAGHGTKALRMDAWADMRVPVPTAEDQDVIARCLDHETAKIDALVEEQQRLIELLKEKRQAVISQAVTKGLDPNVPMKDSGVEWLGKVPAHWEVGPLKRFWTVTDCKHITAEFVDGGIPLASIREVQGWSVDLSGAKQTTEHFYDQLIEGGRKPVPGDIIFTRNATVGEAALVPEDPPLFAMGQDVCLFRRIEVAYSAPFMLRQLKSAAIATQLEGIMIGSTFKRINVEEIRCLTVFMPPVDEQREIAAELEKEADRFDALLDAAIQASLLLQERRAALISAAVTGKIDVRGLAV